MKKRLRTNLKRLPLENEVEKEIESLTRTLSFYIYKNLKGVKIMWHFILGVLAGFVIGIIPWLLSTIHKDRPVGDLVVDGSDRDGPFLFLELNVPLNRVEDKEKVELRVVHKNYISQN